MSHFIDNTNRISILEYIVVFILLCVSGNPIFVYANTSYLFLISSIFMCILCIYKKRPLINNKFVFILICSCLLFIFQSISLEQISIPANINFIFRLYTAFLASSILGYKFREIYFRVIVFLCTISIVFFFGEPLIGKIGGIRIDRYNSIIFYNYILDGSYRNSGMFWEPGAFQGYIIIALLISIDKLNVLWKSNKRECIIIFITILTTQSTTGYIAFTVFIALTLLYSVKINILYKIVILIIATFFVFYIWNLDFMSDKIIREYNDAMEMKSGDISWSRFGSMIIDIQNIARHPVTGNGFILESRYGIWGEYMKGAGNGLSGAINIFGIPFILIFFICIYRNLSHFSRIENVIIIIIIILLMFGEYFINYPLMWFLLFVTIPNDEKNSYTSHSSQS